MLCSEGTLRGGSRHLGRQGVVQTIVEEAGELCSVGTRDAA